MVLLNGKKTVFRGIGAESLKKYKKRARLLTDNDAIPEIDKNLELPVSDLEIFFDVETDPMRDICYLHGFYMRKKG